MQEIKFTTEEKLLASRILKEKRGRAQAFFGYAVYIFPSLLFASYGLYKTDFGAIVVAYLALLLVAIIYLSYANNSSMTLKGLIEKYEEQIKSLANSSNKKT